MNYIFKGTTFFLFGSGLSRLGLSNRDKAIELMNKAYIERDPFLFYTKTLPMYDYLRSDPRFIELLKKMGLEK